MAYIADLIHVLDIIFMLIASRREKKVTTRIIKTTIVLYQASQKRRDVYTTIKLLPITFFGGCNVKSEMESIAKSRYTINDDLKEKIEKIMPAELEGDEDWDPPQSHSSNLAQ